MITQQMNRGIMGAEVISRIHTPAAATNAVVTVAADAIRKHVIHSVEWSYSAAPTGGRLTIEDGAGTIIFDVDIIAGGPGGFSFTRAGSPNKALIITLFSGGGVVVGKLNVQTTSIGAS